MKNRAWFVLLAGAVVSCVDVDSQQGEENLDESELESDQLAVGSANTPSTSGTVNSSGGASAPATNTPPSPDASPYDRYGALNSGIVSHFTTPTWAGPEYVSNDDFATMYSEETDNLTGATLAIRGGLRMVACDGSSDSSLCGFIAALPYGGSATTACAGMADSGGTVVGYIMSDNTYRARLGTSTSLSGSGSSATKSKTLCMYFADGLKTAAYISSDPARCATGRC